MKNYPHTFPYPVGHLLPVTLRRGERMTSRALFFFEGESVYLLHNDRNCDGCRPTIIPDTLRRRYRYGWVLGDSVNELSDTQVRKEVYESLCWSFSADELIPHSVLCPKER